MQLDHSYKLAVNMLRLANGLSSGSSADNMRRCCPTMPTSVIFQGNLLAVDLARQDSAQRPTDPFAILCSTVTSYAMVGYGATLITKARQQCWFNLVTAISSLVRHLRVIYCVMVAQESTFEPRTQHRTQAKPIAITVV